MIVQQKIRCQIHYQTTVSIQKIYSPVAAGEIQYKQHKQVSDYTVTDLCGTFTRLPYYPAGAGTYIDSIFLQIIILFTVDSVN